MSLELDLDTPFAWAVRAAGSQSAFGRLIGKRQSVVHDWLRRGVLLPAEHCRAVEAATGISRHKLRPDVYGPEPTAAPEPLSALAEIGLVR